MATLNINVSYEYESGYLVDYHSPNTSTANRLQLVIGDTLQLNAAGNGTIVFSGFNSTYFTNSANLSLDTTASGSRVVKTTGFTPPVNLEIAYSIYTDGVYRGGNTIYLQIVSNIDGTPDAFSIGPSITGARLGALYAGSDVIVSGINTGVAASVNSGGSLFVNDVAVTSPHTVYAGDVVTAKRSSSGSYNTAVTLTLTIGGVSASRTITTMLDPAAGEVINFPKTALPINLEDVIDFFGGQYLSWDPTPRNLGAYLKGGSYVPNISKNAAIPTTLPLNLSSFIGSGTAFFLMYAPPFKEAGYNTLYSGQRGELTWVVGVDYDIGFGDRMKHNVEYRYNLEPDSESYPEGAYLSLPENVWNGGNQFITVFVDFPHYREQYHTGRIRIDIRNLFDPSKIITTYAYYRLYCFGP